MANRTLQGRIKIKTDTSANWSSHSSFVPLKGEICYYSDLNKAKVGNGSSTIASLPFLEVEYADYGRALKNKEASDVLDFAASCVDGVTAFTTSSSATNVPSDEYKSSTGIVHKYDNGTIEVCLKNKNRATRVINTCTGGTWTGWQILMHLKAKEQSKEVTQSAVNDYWSLTFPPKTGYTRVCIDAHVLDKPANIIVKNYAFEPGTDTIRVHTQNIAGSSQTFRIVVVVLYFPSLDFGQEYD